MEQACILSIDKDGEAAARTTPFSRRPYPEKTMDDNKGPAQNSIIIEGASITHRFGTRTIFTGVSIVAFPGGPAAITGPNGSGKSTLLEILAGLRRPTDGSVMMRIQGEPHTASLERFVGFASPRLRLYEELTALETLDFIAQNRLSRERGRELIGRFGLEDRAHSRVGAFSTGMMQRLKLIAAALNDPPILLLDEPCSNLDEDGRRLVFEYLASVKDRKAIVIATNDPGEADFCEGRASLG